MGGLETVRVYTGEGLIDGERIVGLNLIVKALPSHVEYTGKVLPIRFSGRDFSLPVVTVNPGDPREKHLSIAWFDPRRPDLAEAAASDMGRMIAGLNPDLVLFPASSKSMALSHLAVGEAMLLAGRQDIQLQHFSGGDDSRLSQEIEINEREGNIWMGVDMTGKVVFGITYIPVTVRTKHLWFTTEDMNFLRRFNPKKIILGDDIVTTAATIEAMRRLLGECDIGKDFPVAVVAAAFEGNEACSDHSINYAIRLPEIIGKF